MLVGERHGKSRGELLRDLGDHIAELVEPRTHVERIRHWKPNRHDEWRTHRSEHPSLLDQLRERADPTFRQRGDMIPFGNDRVFQSSPAADINAVACLHAIDAAARRFLLNNGGLITAGWRLEDILRALVGAAGNLDRDGVADVARAANEWRSEALTRCGWQTQIGATRCPECRAPSGVRGLRIRVDRESAMCVSCGTAWSAASMGILGRRIQADRDHGSAAVALVAMVAASVALLDGVASAFAALL